MKHVLVTVCGRQQDVYGEETNIEMTVAGRYYCKNGVHYITYNEPAASEMAGTTTTLKVYNDYVVLLRTGLIDQKQEFRLGAKHVSIYRTVYGSLELGVHTRQLTATFGIASGAIDVEYDLEVDGHWQSANMLSVGIREENNYGH